jgi:hypothetical protein
MLAPVPVLGLGPLASGIMGGTDGTRVSPRNVRDVVSCLLLRPAMDAGGSNGECPAPYTHRHPVGGRRTSASCIAYGTGDRYGPGPWTQP